MKIISWNVNGIRSLKKPVGEVLEDLGADILCLQETKANRSTLEDNIINIPGYSSYFCFPKYQSGYSGVATFCRNEIRPVCAEEGLSGKFIASQHRGDAVGFWPSPPDISGEELKALEIEGRALVTKHTIKHNDVLQDIAVINVYCPRVDCLKPERADFQLQFFKLLQRRAEEILKSGCGVYIVGDVNTSRHPIDSCEPGDLDEFSKRPSRLWLNEFLRPVNGTQDARLFVDSFRHFYPEKQNAYTCWSTLTGARKTNYGTRIDYVLVDKDSIHLVQDSLILSEVEGSDHCPVGVLIDCQMIAREKCPSICSKYWPEFSGQQRKLTNFLKAKESDTQCVVKRRKCDVKHKQLNITNFVKKHKKLSITANSTEELPCSNSCVQDCQEVLCQGTETEAEARDVQSSHNKKSNQVSAWKLMLKGPPKAPKCSGHNEICLLRTVQKEGLNYGKQFFVCSRPVGEKSNKEARCNYFKWAV